MLSYLIICYYILLYAIICYYILLYAIICYHILLYAIICYYILLYTIICYYNRLFSCAEPAAGPAGVSPEDAARARSRHFPYLWLVGLGFRFRASLGFRVGNGGMG